ncbi:amidohydrolase family protein [Chloroflexota bacterium]
MYAGKIIDCRCRPPTELFKEQFKALDRLLRSIWTSNVGFSLPEWLNQTMADFVREMKELNMIGVVVGRYQQAGLPNVTNEHVKEIMDTYPGMFIGIGGIDGNHPDQAREEINLVAEWGFKGISFSSGQPGDLAPDDKRLYPVYQQMADLGLVFYVVTSPIYTTTPFSFDRVAADFPGLRIFLAHGGYPLVDELITLVWRRSNVWYSPDCYQFSPGAQRYIEAVNYSSGEPEYRAYPLYFQTLQDRYCFGSAIPYSTPLKVRVKDFLELDWREEVLPKILYQNAAALFSV